VTAKQRASRKPTWEPSARTASHGRRAGADRRVAIMPACEPIRTTLNGLTGITGQMVCSAADGGQGSSADALADGYDWFSYLCSLTGCGG